jgi:hypothetical protein
MNEFNTEDIKIWKTAADKLSGKDKRMFMAQVVDRLGRGGQRFAERELKWCRNVIQKGKRELNGEDLEGDLSARGRKKSEVHSPGLLKDIRAIVEPISQTDPSFRSVQLYSPITAKEVHRRLKDDKGYSPEDLPCIRTISTKLKDLGFRLRRVQKSKPLKKNS